MTREEYIDFANALKNNYTIDFDKLPEFCDMAIKALPGNLVEEQLKPCPFCGHTKSHITQKKVGGSYHNWTDSHSEFVKIRYCVICNKCKATGKSVVTPKMYYRPIESLDRVKYSGETCRYYEKQAMLAWNLRIGG